MSRWDRDTNMIEIVVRGHSIDDFIEIVTMPVVQVCVCVCIHVVYVCAYACIQHPCYH
jgi:hypothetical protein